MDITVVDIVNCAEVARASFYRNFNSINDVINEIAEEMSEELVEDICPIIHHSNDRRWREFLVDQFYHLQRRQRQISNLCPENESILFTKINEKMQRTESVALERTEWDWYLTAGKLGLINSISTVPQILRNCFQKVAGKRLKATKTPCRGKRQRAKSLDRQGSFSAC